MSGNTVTLRVLRGQRAGYVAQFDVPRIVMGRRADCDLVLGPGDAKCSGQHAELAWRDGQLWLSDLRSTNGTYLRSGRVGRAVAVKSGDVIELGQGGPNVVVEWGVVAADRTQAVSLDTEFGLSQAQGRTAIFRAMALEVRQTRSRLRVMLLALAGLVVVATGVIWSVVRRSGDRAEAAQATADAALSGQDAARRVAEGNSDALFMLIATGGPGPAARDEGFCTAFAVAPAILATNAHCVRAMEAMEAEGRQVVARMNRHPEKTWPVSRSKVHPGYTGDPRSPDVALLDLRGAALSVVARLASAHSVQSLAAGQAVFTLGFPGQVMNEAMPAADLREAVLSRLTDFNNTPGTPATAQMVWHTALTSKGTSGAPLFNERGEVVAVNNGGLSARTLTIKDPETGELRSEVTYEATGLNFGVRVDLLHELLGAQ